jgi:hypothetical protein
MDRRILRFLILAIAFACAAGISLAEDKAKPGLELTLKPLGWGKEGDHFPAGRPIPLQLILANRGTLSTEVRLKDHGRDGGQEPLWGIAARVSDATGKLLTGDPRDIHGDGWWSATLADPCVGADCEMPGDRVTIPPGKAVTRKADLAPFLASAPGLRRGLDSIPLPAGAYTVQLSLNGLASAPIRIVVD